jgi:hypothetical protein
VDEEEAERTYQALKELDQLTELDSPVIEEIETASDSIRSRFIKGVNPDEIS